MACRAADSGACNRRRLSLGRMPASPSPPTAIRLRVALSRVLGSDSLRNMGWSRPGSYPECAAAGFPNLTGKSLDQAATALLMSSGTQGMRSTRVAAPTMPATPISTGRRVALTELAPNGGRANHARGDPTMWMQMGALIR